MAGLAVAATGAVFLLPRIPDPAWWYDFADRRRMLGIPNCLNVISNAPWAVIGVFGLRFIWRTREVGPGCPFSEEWERKAIGVLFAAIGLLAFGSAHFHLAPSPATLVWDRLPMAVIFMAVLALTVAERIGMRAGRMLFLPLVAAGILSVLYWSHTETIGMSDVRFYGLVQFFPVLAIPAMVLLLPPRYTRTGDLLGVVGWYALAKGFEVLDAPVFAAGRIVSGHTLKHLAAAMATYWLLRMVRLRRQ